MQVPASGKHSAFVGHLHTKELDWVGAKRSHPVQSQSEAKVLRHVGEYTLVELTTRFWAWLPDSDVPAQDLGKNGKAQYKDGAPIRVWITKHWEEKCRLVVGVTYKTERQSHEGHPQLGDDDVDHGVDEAFEEGDERFRLHRKKERNKNLVKKKRKEVLEKTGKLLCEACSFDFERFYGPELGQGFAECHHRIPLASLEPGHKSLTKELAILCSNCHRIIHRTKAPMWSVERLRQHIEQRRDGEDLEW